ncbi:GGDEF domain-containing protein [Actinomycetes bacterium M1A6_2h]
MERRSRSIRSLLHVDRFDARTGTVIASASGALPLLILGVASPTFLKPGGLPVLATIVAFTLVTVGIGVRAGRLTETQFTVLGSGGMIGVAVSAFLIADPSAARAVTSMLAVVPAIAASGSPPKVTVALTTTSVAMASALTFTGATSGAVTFVAVGAAVTIVLVPVLLIATIRRSLVAVTARLETLAYTDSLTGLLNRRGMLTRVETMLDAAASSDNPLTVLIIDVDHFKTVNDRFGHAAGDQVLVTVADAISAAVGDSVSDEDAVVARIGGEEFVVLCRHATPTAVQSAVLESVRTQCQVTVSIGAVDALVVHGDGALSDVELFVDQLIRVADRALYAAKNEGRDRGVQARAEAFRWKSESTVAIDILTREPPRRRVG